MKLKQALHGKLTAKQLKLVPSSFDIIGNIAIIEIPKQLKKYEKTIGKALLSILKNIKTVAAEAGEHTGKYRRQKLRIIAGEKNLETTQKESGITLKTNAAKCYYSPRLGSERLRIAKQAKKREKILVAGSGIAPYPIILAKYSQASEITGIETNPVAHKYAIENVKMNKVQNKIKLVKGDIRKAKLGKFDRIISAIPHEGTKLIPALLKFAKKGTIFHVYDFAYEEDLSEPARKLEGFKILQVVKTQQVGVRRYRVCIDAKLI
jgi:tRNA (guanine37-N1)-methyltransferase